LYTRDVDNLFMAGRHVSVTHVALGSTRLMQTIGTMGQAVGAAAYLCIKHRQLPRNINPSYIKQLQQLLLKWDAYIPHIAHEDSADLCRGAKVTASSSLPDGSHGVFGAGDLTPYAEAPCTTARGQRIGVTSADQDTISLQLRTTGDQPFEARLHVGEEGEKDPIVIKANVRPGGFRWADFRLPAPLEPGKVYLVWMPATPQLVWRIARDGDGERVYGRPGAWTVVGGSYMIKPNGLPRPLGRVGPEAAVDGVKWPFEGQCHQWRSDPRRGLPQWIEVDFGKPMTLNTIYLTFDTNIYGRFPSDKAGSEVTAEDYRLLYNDAGHWKVAFTEKANWRRFRRHQFTEITTDKIRLEVLKAINGNEARLYEIRAYKE
ncbi:MAG: FAD-dependent oxidoreductase, partial [Verrucomicrobiae bacterium]|nr:FAD-dependent oxidoreductase [Verrucomicrobiae bacterium]